MTQYMPKIYGMASSHIIYTIVYQSISHITDNILIEVILKDADVDDILNLFKKLLI